MKLWMYLFSYFSRRNISSCRVNINKDKVYKAPEKVYWSRLEPVLTMLSFGRGFKMSILLVSVECAVLVCCSTHMVEFGPKYSALYVPSAWSNSIS